ncbi:hypothetical protein BJ944DRAFT_161177 [Cunninghamella echinulata]|nr:hypothetical protein BJ944DRAFT_161177 [Cunninghamella echinulata]
MAATQQQQQISTLYTELNKAAAAFDDEHSLTLCDQIIKLGGNDISTALHCKVIALIRLGRYNDALSLISRKFRDNTTIDLSFEKLYCYYRTNQWQQASDLLETIKKSHPNDTSLLYLEAQLYYSQDKYKEAVDIYETLIKQIDVNDHIYEEVQVNLLAAKTGLLFDHPEESLIVDIDPKHSGYEVTYNTATALLAQGDFNQAINLLEEARKHCSERLREQGLPREEIDEELAVIATQLAYAYQMQGRVDEAKVIYQDVVTLKIRDNAVNAVVANNLVTIQKADDLFDSAKKMKTANGKDADVKLRKYQKRIISMNEGLLQMYMNKLYLILAGATYHQQKKADKAIEELQAFAKQHPSSLAIRFATIQLELLSSQPVKALKTLEDYLAQQQSPYQHPAVVALLVWLYEQTNQSEKAMTTLDEASVYWKQNNVTTTTTATAAAASVVQEPELASPSILKQTAAFKLKSERYHDAAVDYEQLVKEDPTDIQAIAGLVAAYAEIDPLKAEQYGQALPSITSNTNLNMDDLEHVVPGVKKGYVKKDMNSQSKKLKKIKSKKRAPLLPKNYDANKQPDPERWLALRDRSTYKPKGKNKKSLNRGPQGMTLEGGGIGSTGSARIAGLDTIKTQTMDEESKSPSTPTKSSNTSTPSSSNKNANKNKNKKGKGKGKGKW